MRILVLKFSVYIARSPEAPDHIFLTETALREVSAWYP